MSELTQADRYLIEQIRQGSSEGWTQLVNRYSGRLVAFARSKVGKAADAEDIVQETFISFLKGLEGYREQASVETYLFGILRRRIIDWYRGRKANVCLLQDLYRAADDDEGTDAEQGLMSPGATASWYVRQDEQVDLQRAAMTRGLARLINDLKQSVKLRDLKVIEMIFYCQLRNKDIAAVAAVAEGQVALLKHRYLKQLQEYVRDGGDAGGDGIADSLTQSAGAARCSRGGDLAGAAFELPEAQYDRCPSAGNAGGGLGQLRDVSPGASWLCVLPGEPGGPQEAEPGRAGVGDPRADTELDSRLPAATLIRAAGIRVTMV